MCLCLGFEESEDCVYTCGSWALLYRGLYHGTGLSLPLGLALDLGLHPWVNTTPSRFPFMPDSLLKGLVEHLAKLIYEVNLHRACEWDFLHEYKAERTRLSLT